MKDNIFTYEGVKGELVETFYKLLATGDVVSYESILTEYDGGVLSTPKITAHNQYNTLKKVVPEVISAPYIPAFKNEYKFLIHTVGIRFEEGAELTIIRLRAHDKYTFGRLTTKPLHDSQIVVEHPN